MTTKNIGWNFDNSYLQLPEIGLGSCGDWMTGSKAENSWQSASLLAKAIMKDVT